MKLTKTLIATTIALSMAFSAFALDGTEIMTKVYDRKKPDFSKAAVIMTLTDKNGNTEVRQVGEYGRNKNDLTDTVMIFFSPASVKDTRFLQKENKGTDDDKWIFLPALRTTRRVASSDGDKAFVGTDFTYDDMSTREVEEDTHELLKESETKFNFDCYVVKSTPKDSKDQYLYRISWVDKDSWIPVYIELYDKKGKLQKINSIPTLKKMQGATGHTYNIPVKSLMENVQTNHSTCIEIKNIELDKPLQDGYFSPNFLQTGRL
ncbi:MAG: outer membrane lipoprotein-sorting protein [Treponema sp.]|nr:outer membrane lipoprotein-sorting protein [Treponema sp.]